MNSSTNEKTANRAQRRVLITDDNQDSAESLAMLVRMWGHEVCTAAEGATAVSISASFNPDVALLDIGLPGMSGYELAHHLRESLGDGILLVAMTGYGQSQDRQRSKLAGFDFHMVKPVDLDELQQVISGAPRSG